MTGRGQRLAVAAAEDDAAGARGMDVAGHHAMGTAPLYLDAHLADIAHVTGLHLVIGAAGDGDARAQAVFDDEPAQDDVADVGQTDNRRGEGRKGDAGLVHRSRRVEVQARGRVVKVVFARRVQFFEYIERLVPPRRRVALLDAVDGRLCQGDLAGGGVHGLDAEGLIEPVETPVALQPHALVHLPVRRRLVVRPVLEDAAFFARVAGAGNGPGVDDFRDVRPALIGPAGDGHALVIEKQFRD